MNYLSERVAYLKGLFEGMKMSELTNEGKLFRAMIDVMEDMVFTIEDLEVLQEQQNDQICDLEQDLSEMGSYILNNEMESECDENKHQDEKNEHLEQDIKPGSWCDQVCEHEIYMIECPYCFEVIELEKETFSHTKTNTIGCPRCNEEIDIEWLRDCNDI